MASISSVLLIMVLQLLCCYRLTGAASSSRSPTCPAGYKNCDRYHRNRCSTYIKTDVKNCGNCGVKCGTRPHSSPTCSNFRCGFTCNKAWKNCDQKAENGCETCVQADINNCGDCSKRCPRYAHTTGPKCTNSACTGVCQAGWKDCNNNLSLDGCEAQLQTDKKNCGYCGTRCLPAANADGMCVNGKCGIQCYKGYANCDRITRNGCEARLDTDILNCGTCGTRCACPPHTTPTCSRGSCGYACQVGFQNCNGDTKDGCEVDIKTFQTNPMNCGRCNTTCPAPANAIPKCTGGECGFTCKATFQDCNGDPTDGCEVDIKTFQTDLMNCGRCNTTCPVPANAIPKCTGGECGFTCNAGFQDCNGDPTDGCEIPIASFQTDEMNCGGCNATCTAPPNAYPVCFFGGCGFACNPGIECVPRTED